MSKPTYTHPLGSSENELPKVFPIFLENVLLTEFQNYLQNELLGHRFPREGAHERISRSSGEQAWEGFQIFRVRLISTAFLVGKLLPPAGNFLQIGSL